MRWGLRADLEDSGSWSDCKAELSPTLVLSTTSRPSAIRIRLKRVLV